MIINEKDGRIRIKLDGHVAKSKASLKSAAEFFQVYKGEKGEPGRGIKAVEQVTDDAFKLTFTDESESLLSLPRGRDGESIKGEQGLPGKVGKQGPAGRGIASITQPEDDIMRVTLTDRTSFDIELPRGEDGKQIELRATQTHIQWRYVGEKNWKNLVALSLLGGVGGDGASSFRLRLRDMTDIVWATLQDNYILSYDAPSKSFIWVPNSGGGGAVWGAITGTLSNQTDLQNALNAKLSISAFSTTADTWLATKNTDDLAEGAINLYDQLVSISGDSDIDVTGIYPNFALSFINGSGFITGNQTITLSGDVTGTGATSITTTIANDAVTFAKFQNISTDRLLGRDTTSSGDVEEITVGGGIEFTTTGGIQSSAYTGDVTKTAGGTTLTLANTGVTAGTYGSGSVSIVITVDAKGRATGISTTPITFPTTPTLQQVTTAGGTSNVNISLSGNNSQTGGYYRFNTNIPAQFGSSAEASIVFDTGLVIKPDTTSNIVTIGSATGTASGDLRINKLGIGGSAISADAIVNGVITGGSRQVLNFGLTYTSSANGAGIIVSDFDDEGTNITITHINADLSSQLRTAAHTTSVNHYGTRTQMGIAGGAIGAITAGTLTFYGHRVMMSANGNANSGTSGGTFRRYGVYVDPIGNIAGSPAADLQMGIYTAESFNIIADEPIILGSTATAKGDSYLIYNSATTDIDLYVNGTQTVNFDNDLVDFIVPPRVTGSTGTTLRFTNAATAPGTTLTPAFTSYYGGNTNALGDPNAWALVNVNGTDYKIPLYT